MSDQAQPSELDLITRIREMYRQDNGLSVVQIAARLNLSRQQAKSLFDAAHKQEMAVKDAFADEAKRVEEAQQPIPARDPDFYIKDRETGALFKLQMQKDTPKRIIFETEDVAVNVGRGL